MPKLNEIKLGHEIDKKNPFQRFIWSACEKCNKPRWVVLFVKENRPTHSICVSCGRGKPKGFGRGHYDKDGYITKSLPWDHPYISMANNRGWIYEHRLVMAQHLGRDLLSSELVHHLNGVRDDNRLENLTVMERGAHTHLEVPYKKRILELERQIDELQSFTTPPQPAFHYETCGGQLLTSE